MSYQVYFYFLICILFFQFQLFWIVIKLSRNNTTYQGSQLELESNTAIFAILTINKLEIQCISSNRSKTGNIVGVFELNSISGIITVLEISSLVVQKDTIQFDQNIGSFEIYGGIGCSSLC